jgi:hypothetical protein
MLIIIFFYYRNGPNLSAPLTGTKGTSAVGEYKSNDYVTLYETEMYFRVHS